MTQSDLPLVLRDQVIHAYRPSSPPSDAAFRTLRRNRVVSAGLSSVMRRPTGGRLSGTLHFYCALNRDAALLWRLDDRKAAVRVGRAAAKVERSAAAKGVFRALQQQLKTQPRSASQLSKALANVALDANVLVALMDLTRQIDAERRTFGAQFPTLAHPRPGRVARLNDELVSVLLADGTYVNLPRASFAEQDLAYLGAPVVLTWEARLPGEVVVRVEPALTIPTEPAKRRASRAFDRRSRGREPSEIVASLRALTPWPTRLRQ